VTSFHIACVQIATSTTVETRMQCCRGKAVSIAMVLC